MHNAATRKANHIEEPVMPTASPGSTNMPLSIPPMLTAMAPGNDNVLSSFFNLLFIFIKVTNIYIN